MKLIVLGTGVVAATGLSMALFGTGIAAADDYAGQTYGDARRPPATPASPRDRDPERRRAPRQRVHR